MLGVSNQTLFQGLVLLWNMEIVPFKPKPHKTHRLHAKLNTWHTTPTTFQWKLAWKCSASSMVVCAFGIQALSWGSGKHGCLTISPLTSAEVSWLPGREEALRVSASEAVAHQAPHPGLWPNPHAFVVVAPSVAQEERNARRGNSSPPTRLVPNTRSSERR